MIITIRRKTVVRVAIAAALIALAATAGVYAVGVDATLDFLYQATLDVLENFLRLPERLVV